MTLQLLAISLLLIVLLAVGMRSFWVQVWLWTQTGLWLKWWHDKHCAVPAQPAVVLVSRPVDFLSALALRRCLRQPITWLNELDELTCMQRLACRWLGVEVITQLPEQINKATLMSYARWFPQQDNLSHLPIYLTHCPGASEHSNSLTQLRQRWLYLYLQNAPSKADIGLMLESVEVAAWQRFVHRAPSLLAQWLWQTRRRRQALAMADTTGAKLSRINSLVGFIALRSVLKTKLAGQQSVAICLPTSVGGCLALLVLISLDKTIINLNYTASWQALSAAIKDSGVSTVITSKRFNQKLASKGMEIEQSFSDLQQLPLEQLHQEITTGKKLACAAAAWLLPYALLCRWLNRRAPCNDTMFVLFSSGSSGRPKGIKLSESNILGNIKQIAASLNGTKDDIMVNVLPIFHAFGLTATSLLPLVEGVPTVMHPDPTDASAVGRLVAKWQGTILCGTSTFYRIYTKSRHLPAHNFASLRYVIAGAEKLNKDTKKAFEQKFNKHILEGYGATELSPVAAVNLPDTVSGWARSKEGTVGKPLIGCAVRIIDPETYQQLPTGQAGMIAIAGVNVMQGYLHNDQQTKAALWQRDGMRFYLTGDKGHLDEQGFLIIVDRYSRFAKIGGEMVSLGEVEQSVAQALPDREVDMVAVAVEDQRKGEQIVLLYADSELAPSAVKKAVQTSKISNLTKPHRYCQVDEIPKLGTGKTSYGQAKELALTLTARAEG